MVCQLDGTIVGVDGSSGARLWSFDTGAPLVSVRQADPPHGHTPLNIFPGIDGSLYAYHGRAEDGQAQLEVRQPRQLRYSTFIAVRPSPRLPPPHANTMHAAPGC